MTTLAGCAGSVVVPFAWAIDSVVPVAGSVATGAADAAGAGGADGAAAMATQQNAEIVEPSHDALQLVPVHEEDRERNFGLADVVEESVLEVLLSFGGHGRSFHFLARGPRVPAGRYCQVSSSLVRVPTRTWGRHIRWHSRIPRKPNMDPYVDR